MFAIKRFSPYIGLRNGNHVVSIHTTSLAVMLDRTNIQLCNSEDQLRIYFCKKEEEEEEEEGWD